MRPTEAQDDEIYPLCLTLGAVGITKPMRY